MQSSILARDHHIALSSNGRISDSDSEGAGSSPAGAAIWFVSIVANISDCRSEVAGSIPARTANMRH